MRFGRLSWSGSADLNATLGMSNFSWGPKYPQFLPIPGSTPIKSSTLLLGISRLHTQYMCTCTRIYLIPALGSYPDIPSYVPPMYSCPASPYLPWLRGSPPMYHVVHRTSHSSAPILHHLSDFLLLWSPSRLRPYHPEHARSRLKPLTILWGIKRSVLYIIALVPWTLSRISRACWIIW